MEVLSLENGTPVHGGMLYPLTIKDSPTPLVVFIPSTNGAAPSNATPATRVVRVADPNAPSPATVREWWNGLSEKDRLEAIDAAGYKEAPLDNAGEKGRVPAHITESYTATHK